MKDRALRSCLPALALILILAFPGNTQSQVYQEEITVVAPYEPTISDALKINLNPKTSDTVSLRKSFTYQIQSTTLPTSFSFTPLKPARLSGEPLTKLYSNYLRAGMGTYTSPFFDYYYNSQRSKDLNYGIRAKHFSSSGKLPDVGFPGRSHNELGLNVRHLGKKGHTKYAGLTYDRDVIHYYGFRVPDSLEAPKKADYKQWHQEVDLDLGIFRHDSDKKKLYYDTRLNLNHFSTLSKSREFAGTIQGSIKKNFNFFDFSDLQELSVTGAAGLVNTVLADSSMGTASLITLQPTFRTQLGEFELHAGLRADIMTDSASNMQLSPVVGLKIDVMEHALCISFGLDGNVIQNSMRKIIHENPFAGDHQSLPFRINKLRFYGGLDGRLGRHIGFSSNISVSKIDNAGFFVSDTSTPQGHPFMLVYDNMNLFEGKVAFTFNLNNKWQSKLRMHYQKFSLGNITPWHLPEFSGSFLLSYNVKEKIILKTELFGATEQYAPYYDVNGMAGQLSLDPYLDINFGAEYRYSKVLSGFFELNNIANRHYEVWSGYPVQGLRFLAGLTYSF